MGNPIGGMRSVLPSGDPTNRSGEALKSLPGMRGGGHGVVVSPVRGDLTIVSSFFEFKGFALEWSEGRLKWLKSVLSEHVPALRDARLEGYQTGFRPCTPDMLPVVGGFQALRTST
jgi:glycine/D-amino acid oxidase-like deaminating enzyme